MRIRRLGAGEEGRGRRGLPKRASPLGGGDRDNFV